MSKQQRDKGKRGEQMAVQELRQVFPSARRKVTNHAGVENGVDLELTGIFRVQVKNHKRYVPMNAIEEIADTTGIPLLVSKAERQRWLAVLPLDDLLKILKLVPGVENESLLQNL